jgi:hypothetical protein
MERQANDQKAKQNRILGKGPGVAKEKIQINNGANLENNPEKVPKVKHFYNHRKNTSQCIMLRHFNLLSKY